ncbi:MAG: RluA family pseudouridine synthase [Nannocystaceae bacterium]|nr:RluA family pseudouridine synthase [Nannocystaceae bacterium]
MGEETLGQRLDRVLVQVLCDAGHVMSRNALRASFDAGDVTQDGRRLKPSFEVVRPMVVSVVLHPPAPLSAVPEPVPLSILHEDADVLVIDKAAGIVVHPSAGHAGGTLVNGVLHHLGVGADGLPVLPGNDATRPGVVHRLDRDTSGVMVFTKTPAAAASLAAQFQAHSIERRYMGVLSAVPEQDCQRLDTPHNRDPAERKRFAPVDGSSSRRAVTHMELVERMPTAAIAHFTLETGRTHQIRMHARHLGAPIFGDTLYGKPPRDEVRRGLWTGLGRHALHAEILGFEHPQTGATVRFEAAPPPELQALVAALRTLP